MPLTTTTCSGCGKRCVWALGENGKRYLLDIVAPVFVTKDQGGRLVATRAPEGTYVLHFATCSYASQFSKRNKPAGA